MATARPLRLKRQESTHRQEQVALKDPYLEVWVDNSVAHLDGTYDYLIPERLSEKVSVGTRIAVPFAGRTVEALVIARNSKCDQVNLKFIASVLSDQIVATSTLIELIKDVSRRWLCHPYDIIRVAIPSRVASVDKLRGIGDPKLSETTKRSTNNSSISYLQLEPHENSLRKLADFAIKEQAKGSVLIVLPEERELQEISALLGDKALVLSSSLTRTQRYSNYLQILSQNKCIAIGTRSAIFATPRDLQTLIVYRENSQSHFEPRHPEWNVRDIALLRCSNESLNLHFVGYAPSLVLANLIESGRVKYLAKKSRLKVNAFTPRGTELLPERIFTPIRNALKNGPVLFLVPKKGYASALMCQKCKNIATCPCGGKLARKGASFPPECVHCAKNFPSWNCKWCGQDKLTLLGRGAIRHAEEIGRAFPGYVVINSDAENYVAEISNPKTLVVATQGMAPRYDFGYSAVVLLEGGSFFSYADLRGQERSREAFFDAANKVSIKGEILVAIDPSHPICAALSLWNPAHMYKRELAELEQLQLPPFSRVATLDVPVKEAISIIDGLKKALLDLRLPVTAKVLGPSIRNSDNARIIISSDPTDFAAVTEFLREYVKHRSISKKVPLRIRIDPYSLS